MTDRHASSLRDITRFAAWSCLLGAACHAQPHAGQDSLGATTPVTVHVSSDCGTTFQVYLDQVGGDGWVSLTESGDRDLWEGRTEWRGRTDICVQRGGPVLLSVLGSFIADGSPQELWPADPRGRLSLLVTADIESFPIQVCGLWSGARLPGFVNFGQLAGPGEHLDVGCLPTGDYVLTALPASGSLRARDGTLVAVGRASLQFDGDAAAVTLVDDSRWFEVETLDEQGRALPGVTVTAESSSIRLASSLTDDLGRCRLRVVGQGPFHLGAVSIDGHARLSDPVNLDEPDGLVRFTMHPAASVTFVFRDKRSSGPAPARLRYVGTGAVAGRTLDLDLEQAWTWVLPVSLLPGDWMVQLLDAEGDILIEKRLALTEPIAHEVTLGL